MAPVTDNFWEIMLRIFGNKAISVIRCYSKTHWRLFTSHISSEVETSIKEIDLGVLGDSGVLSMNTISLPEQVPIF